MHTLTSYCMNHSRPYTIQWNREELLLFNYKITKDIFAVFIRGQLDKLEVVIQSDVLFNISLESIGINCDIRTSMDTGDTKAGWGPFLPEAHPSLINDDSNRFLRALATSDSDQAPVRKVKGELVWDRSKSGCWLMQIDEALQLTYALIHTTGAFLDVLRKRVCSNGPTRRMVLPPTSASVPAPWHLTRLIIKGSWSPECTRTSSGFFRIVFPASC